MNKVQTNNTNLQTILDTVNALPNAGSGGGGGAVETCTVTINNVGNRLRLEYTTVENGEIIGKSVMLGRMEDSLIITMIKNSVLSVINIGDIEDGSSGNISNISLNNGEVLYETYDGVYMDLRHFSVLIVSDGTITIN